MTLNLSKFSKTLLYLLLVTDLSLIILNVVYLLTNASTDALNGFYEHPLRLSTDRGYAEIIGYLKQYSIVLLFGLVAWRIKNYFYLGWSVLFFYLFLDDSLQIHETLGKTLSEILHFPSILNLRPLDLGEFVVSLGIGIFLLSVISLFYRWGDSQFRSVSKDVILMLLALVFVGVIVDLFHEMIPFYWLKRMFTVIEDGGELIVFSFIFAYCFQLPERLIKKATHRHKTLEGLDTQNSSQIN